jgi:uncharacterized protein YegP (UPF0339 family)
MAGRFIVTHDADGMFRFALTTATGEVVATSEAFGQKGAAMNGVDSLRELATDAIVDDRTTSATPNHAD